MSQELGIRLSTNEETGRWLQQQLNETRTKLEDSEAALQRYKEQRQALSVDDRQNIVVQRLSDLNATLTRAKTDRIAKEALYNRALELRTNPASLDTLPGLAGAAYVRQLKDELAALQRRRGELSEQFGVLHPDMIANNASIKDTQSRLDAELAKIAESVHNEYLAALAQERSLTAALEAQKREALTLNQQTLEYGTLERDALGYRELYERLQQQAQQTGLSSDLRAVDIAVVDPAEPSGGPARPARIRNALASIGGGLLASFGIALLLEFLDRRVKTPDQITRDLGLPFFGYIPLVATHDQTEPLLQQDGVPSGFQEAMRRVRANLLLSNTEDGCRTVVVTSAVPREGKTTVSVNLALGLSLGGSRVLLMDADLRRPRVASALGLDDSLGLSGVLSGQALFEKAIRVVRDTTLTVLPAGPCPPNPPELLTSSRYVELMNGLNSRFDWIVIDSPPIMAVADAALLGRDAMGVLFVFGAEMVPLDTARVAVSQLTNVGVNVVGAVLNRLDVRRQGYYYSKYYTPEYERYYTS
jgi:capsular exopolysaccharide synthesis family protein